MNNSTEDRMGKWVVTAGALLLFSATALSHGGGHTPPPPPGPPPPPYGGPGDGAGPPTGGGGGGSPRPTTPGPASPGPTGPSSPGPSGPGTGGPSPRTIIGANGLDLTGWSLWWRFNQHEYLDLKDAIWASGAASETDDSFFLGHGTKTVVPASFRPTSQQLSELVVPSLLLVLEQESQPQVLSGCLTALARIGEVPDASGEKSTVDVITSFFANPNQQMSETAAISLGILGKQSSLSELASLLDDDERGRELTGRSEVPVRTRAFAAYGIGILANQSDNRDAKRYAAFRLASAFSQDDTGSHDLGVACVNALSLVELPSVPEHWAGETGERSPSASREAMLRFLLELFSDRNLKEPVRAHLPRAMVRLIGAVGAEDADSGARATVADALLKALGNTRADRTVRHGCVIGLGLVGDASDTELDREIRKALEKTIVDGDLLGRNLALISLAKVTSRPGPDGSLVAATEGTLQLCNHLATAKSRSRPWAALALGVQGHRLLELGQDLSDETSAKIRASLDDCGSPEDVGAYALALGLRRDVASVPSLLERLFAFSDDNARGSIALGLGMIGDDGATGVLRRLMPEAAYRPDLLRPTAIALALLNDKSMVDYLIRQIAETDSSARRAMHLWALAEVGDVRAVDPVLAMLTDPEVPTLARGIATLAVGFICESGRVPWNTPLAVDVNYLAVPDSLFSPAGGGVLNIR